MKKTRQNSFFGIHFDFHAMEGETVARVYQPEVVADLLDRVKPDFVQCDTKGHAGLSSYPTKAGTQAFLIKHDVLKMWRTLTEERDIALYGHHSGLYDMTVAKNHPDWAIKDENGVVSDSYISPFSPYVDEVLIPQLKELALDYSLDGAWLDGECWGTRIDYSSWATDKYFAETGKKPPLRGEDDYENYRQFCREGFSAYTKRYVDEVKKVAPNFQIASNWMYSAYMPEAPTVNVDFLSGDYNPTKSVDSARYHGRCLANRGFTWDLVAWGQNSRPFSWKAHDRTTKEYVQYCQEASEIIALGGAFIFFNIMYGSGGCVQKWAIPTWEKVGKFVRERENVCFKSKPYQEIAMLFPDEKNDPSNESLYSIDYTGFKSLCPWIDAIQNIQLSCNVINEYQLSDDALKKFKLLIVPNSKFITPDTVKIICNYIKSGGKVIADLKSLKYFSEITGIGDIETKQKLIFVDGGERLASLDTEVADIDINKSTCGVYYDDNYYDEAPHTAAISYNYGKGKFTGMCFDFSESYKNNISVAIESFLKMQLDVIGFSPKVKVLNNNFADVIVMEKDNHLLINLINHSGPHNLDNVRSYNAIPPLYNIDLEIEASSCPSKIYLEPEHKELDFEFKNNKISLTVDRLDVHSIIVI